MALNPYTPKIFISTATRGHDPLEDTLKLFTDLGLNHIELGMAKSYPPNMRSILHELAAKDGFHFLIHNYFPPPDVPFVLNLASNDPESLNRSIEHVQNAVHWCSEFKIPFYSVHAGFCFHACPQDLGQRLSDLEPYSMDLAEDIYVSSLRRLAAYAEDYNVEILIENNVLAQKNLLDGTNKLLLGADTEGMVRLLEGIDSPNVRMLLDVGHLKVSATSLGFSGEDFITRLSPWIRALHIHDNDGLSDSHCPVRRDSWFWEVARTAGLHRAVWILEVQDLHLPEIPDQVQLIDEKLRGMS